MSTETLLRLADRIVFRRSPETLPGCPPWCTGKCTPDQADGSIYHVSDYQPVPGVDGVDVAVSRLDDEDTGPGAATVDLFIGATTAAELTPEQALALAELLRERALAAAGPAGVEMPVERVRLGDQVRTPNGWETVEIHDVDGWLKPEVAHHAVRVNTDAHDEDEQAYRYPIGAIVRVRPGGAR